MHRRDLLIRGGQLAFGLSFLSLPGCAKRAAGGNHVAQRQRALLALQVRLGERIPQWMAKDRVPGLGLCVIQDAGIAWSKSFGVKDAASEEPVTQHTMFEAASMSKPVFAYVVMKLCEAGVMQLDAPLTKYAAQLPLQGDEKLEMMTARHILSHTGGFQNWRSDRNPLRIHFTPGEKHLYSGEGYHYLQTVVTHLLGQDFERYMKARVFAPLGMHSSAYAWDEWIAQRIARPHDPEGQPLENKKSSPAAVARYGSAGAMLTTPTDYAAFVIAVIDPKPADAFRLRRNSIDEMLRPHVKLEGSSVPASWSLGWQIFHGEHRDFIYHGGDNEGFHCAALASVAGRAGYVAMTNGENGASVLRTLLSDDAMQSFLLMS